MKTIILRCDAPMQSWDTNSKFKTRTSGRFPSRSAVIGIIAAAMGMDRTADLDLFSDLRITSRVDDPGVVLPDYQTAGWWTYDFPVNRRAGNALSNNNRYYLEDALIFVFIEGEDDLIDRIYDALLHPVYSIFLGRKSCPPTADFIAGIVHGSTEKAMQEVPPGLGLKPTIIRDAQPGEIGEIVKDVPVSFSIQNRLYAGRQIVRGSNVTDTDGDIFDD